MNYDLVKELQDRDFPYIYQAFPLFITDGGKEPARVPTLEELIDALGEEFDALFYHLTGTGYKWRADASNRIGYSCSGDTHVEAVANLWLALNKK